MSDPVHGVLEDASEERVFRGHTLKECLQVIRKDIITVWNFSDPDKVHFFRLELGIELAKALSRSGDATLGVLVPITGVVIYVAKTMYETYQEAQKDVKHLIAHIVNPVCLMQAIFLLAPGQPSNRGDDHFRPAGVRETRSGSWTCQSMGSTAIWACYWEGTITCWRIKGLIRRYSIKDHEIEELKRRIGRIVTSGPL